VTVTYRHGEEEHTTRLREVNTQAVVAGDPLIKPTWHPNVTARAGRYATRSIPGTSTLHASIFERDTLIALDFDDLTGVAAQPIRITWLGPRGGRYWHVPDFLAVVAGRPTLINCRPEPKIDDNTVVRSTVAAGVARALRWDYAFVTGFTVPAFTNVSTVLGQRSRDGLGYTSRLLDRLSRGRDRFGDLVAGFDAPAVARANLLGLIAQRRVSIDLNWLLCDDSEVWA
jgi:hypothetical protein